MVEKGEDETRFERVTYRTAAGCSTPELLVPFLERMLTVRVETALVYRQGFSGGERQR